MIALYIILGILLLLFLITLIRVQVFAYYSEEFLLTVKILFFKIKILPAKEKPEKKKPEKKPKKEKKQKPKEEAKKEKPEEKKQSYLGKLKEKKGLSGLISLFTSLARIAGGALKGLFFHIVIKYGVGKPRLISAGLALPFKNAFVHCFLTQFFIVGYIYTCKKPRNCSLVAFRAYNSFFYNTGVSHYLTSFPD